MPDLTWDPTDALARCKGETTDQHNALQDYAFSGLSLRNLAAAYRQENPRSDRMIEMVIRWWKARGKPPTRQLTRLELWSVRNDWAARVAAYSDQEAARRQAEHERQVKLAEQSARAFAWRTIDSLEAALLSAENAARKQAHAIAQAVNADSDGAGRVHVTAGVEVGGLGDIMRVYTSAMDELRRALRLPRAYSAGDITSGGEPLPAPSAGVDWSRLPAELIRKLSDYMEED